MPTKAIASSPALKNIGPLYLDRQLDRIECYFGGLLAQYKKYDIAVAGAGPSGLMAAIVAAEAGASVVVFEQMALPGRKLLATGGGRCNITNLLAPAKFVARFGKQANFVKPAILSFNNSELTSFFEVIGVPINSPDGFHCFPVSDSARDVLDALLSRCTLLGVELQYECGARIVTHRENDFLVHTGTSTVACSAFVLATGGRSYPILGATGDGYRLASALGHNIVPQVQALVGLTTREKWPGQCSGVVLKDTSVLVEAQGTGKISTSGDVLFTHKGVSGPAVLDISGEVTALVERDRQAVIRIPLAPGMSELDAIKLLDSWRADFGRRFMRNLLDSVLPASVATALCAELNLTRVTAALLDTARKRALVDALTGVRLTVVGNDGWNNAIVTRGGVARDEVSPRTLESRRVSGLFFAGEVLDVDGPCGGYNLQWAFSSGRLAGKCCAEYALANRKS